MTPSESRWRDLLTEKRHPQTSDLDARSTEEVVEAVLSEDRLGVERALACRREIAHAASWLAQTLALGGTALLVGAGTSGRLAVLEAAECPPTFGTDPERIRAVIAGGPEAVFKAREGAEDRAEDGRQAARQLSRGDLLIGISASSVTPFVQGALEEAGRRGVKSVLLTCAARDGLDDRADLVLALATGPEVLTGSTRLKAGSATKAALNAITTAAMVQVGKVFENLMVDLRAGSAKLRDRAVRIVAAAANVTDDEARRLHVAAEGEVKVAIVMGRLGVDAVEARQKLAAADGHVRRALA